MFLVVSREVVCGGLQRQRLHLSSRDMYGWKHHEVPKIPVYESESVEDEWNTAEMCTEPVRKKNRMIWAKCV